MKKDFKKWHSKKGDIHERRPYVFFQEREIWFCSLGANVGYEQDGAGDDFLRPVIITRKFNNEIFFAVPLTKGKKAEKPFYFSFSFRARSSSTAILSQLRLVDGKRLRYKIGSISMRDFKDLKAKIRRLLA
jgi:mRNA interferase MazF